MAWFAVVVLAAAAAAADVTFDPARGVLQASVPIVAPNLPANMSQQLETVEVQMRVLQCAVCERHGVCADTGCQCRVGWTGVLCEMPASNATACGAGCEHGGTCVQSSSGTPVCLCRTGFSGPRCEQSLRRCASGSCPNGTVCLEDDDGSTAHCGVVVAGCTARPCLNGGQCDAGECLCAAGWTGTQCEHELRPCASSPCANDGACAETSGSFMCLCAAGFTGAQCQINVDECASSPCSNGATCANGIASFVCACAAGFTGAQCQINVDECASSPCSNGGTCTDGMASFACACASPFSGPLCGSCPTCRFGACTKGTTVSRPFICSEFVTTWNTTRTSSGSSSTNQIRLPLALSGSYNFVVQWGDGTSSTVTTSSQGLHTYAAEGQYNVSITGLLVSWRFNNNGDRLKLLNLMQWGTMGLGNLGGHFYGASNMVITATDSPDLTGVTSMFASLAFARLANPPMALWDMSNVDDMGSMFMEASSFNQDISGWNVSRVTRMTSMFNGATLFDHDISRWCVSKLPSTPLCFSCSDCGCMGTSATWPAAKKPQWGACPS
jgi:surface protein